MEHSYFFCCEKSNETKMSDLEVVWSVVVMAVLSKEEK